MDRSVDSSGNTVSWNTQQPSQHYPPSPGGAYYQPSSPPAPMGFQQPPQQQQQPQAAQMVQAAPGSGDFHNGYQQAVRDISANGGRGQSSVAAQAGMTLLNAGIFLGIPLYFIWRLNKGTTGAPGKAMTQMMEQMNPVKKRNFRVTVRDTKFKDVVGIEEAKSEVQEYVDFLRSPTQYQELGARLPRGALLTGKPGTGKTLLAKAVAGEAGVSFYSAGGSDFIEIFGGSGPKRVRELFTEAKENAPAVIFIDELDAVGSKRSGGGDQGIGGEENRTTNALLAEMDGMETKDNVIVFAATNHPEALDTALTRAGRFDRKIEIPVPDEKARADLFSYYLTKIVTAANFEEKQKEIEAKRAKAKESGLKEAEKASKTKELEKAEQQLKDLEDGKKKDLSDHAKDNMRNVLEKSIDKLKKELQPVDESSAAFSVKPTDADKKDAEGMVGRLAARTPGVTPATIATVANEAAICAARNKASFVVEEHIAEALDNVLIGKKHRQRMSPPALKRVAYHEAGHTVAQWLLESQTSVIKVSVVPRGRAGGYTQFRQKEELDPQSQQYLMDQIVVMLGGRCAEKIFFNDYTTGAQDDLMRAFQHAQNLVQTFGMSELGHISLNPGSEQRGRAFSQMSDGLKRDVEKMVCFIQLSLTHRPTPHPTPQTG